MPNELTVTQRAKRTILYGVGGGLPLSTTSVIANWIFFLGKEESAENMWQFHRMLPSLYALSVTGGIAGGGIACYHYFAAPVRQIILPTAIGAVAGASLSSAISFISNLMCEVALANDSSAASSDRFALHGDQGAFTTCSLNPALMFAGIGAGISVIITNADLIYYGASKAATGLWGGLKKLKALVIPTTDHRDDYQVVL